MRMDNPEHALVLLLRVRQAIGAAQERLSYADLSEKHKSDIKRQLADLEPRLEAVSGGMDRLPLGGAPAMARHRRHQQ